MNIGISLEPLLFALRRIFEGKRKTLFTYLALLAGFTALFDARNCIVAGHTIDEYTFFVPLDAFSELYDTAFVHKVIDGLHPAGQAYYAWTEITLDLVFPIFLACFFLWVRSNIFADRKDYARLSWATFAAPVLMALSDLSENTFIAAMSFRPEWIDALAFPASLAGSIKWGLVYLSLALLIIAFIVVRKREAALLARYAFYSRIALVSGGLLVLLAVLGSTQSCDVQAAPEVGLPTIRNMLTFESFFQVMYATLAIYASSAIIVFSGMHMWRLAQVRFNVPRFGLNAEAPDDDPTQDGSTANSNTWRVNHVRWIFALSAFALALPLLIQFQYSGGTLAKLLAIVSGLLLGGIILMTVYKVRRWINDESSGAVAKSMYRTLHQLDRKGFRQWVSYRLGEGYVVPGEQRFYRGHALGLAVFIVLGIGYLIGYMYLHPVAPIFDYFEVPPIAYVALLIAFLCGVLTKLTFIFDRINVPVLLVILAWLMIRGNLPGAEWDTVHHFDARLVTSNESPPPTVIEAFEARATSVRTRSNAPQDTITIISVTGGGIQAAAWGSAVLSGLHQEFGEDFLDSIYFISSTSGGSVGVFYFIEALRHDPKVIQQSPNAAMASSLEATAWGTVFPDLQRWLLPYIWNIETFSRLDRAWSIETAWLRWRDCMFKVPVGTSTFERNSDCRELMRKETFEKQPRLSTWWNEAAAGTLPGIVFNATILEDGQQFLASNLNLSSFDIGKSRDKSFAIPTAQTGEQNHDKRHWSFGGFDPTLCEHYAENPEERMACNKSPTFLDMNAVTAARLSATFPFVTPAASARLVETVSNGADNDSDTHKRTNRWQVGDGGYFDNTGAVAIVRWADIIRKHMETRPGMANARILYIQINPFPDQEACWQQEKDRNRCFGESDTGSWAKSFTGPLNGLFNVRTSSQLARTDLELSLLDTLFDPDSQNEDPGNRFQAIEFRPPYLPNRHSAPLSWELSQADKKQICEDWRANKPVVDALREYFGETPQQSDKLSCTWVVGMEDEEIHGADSNQVRPTEDWANHAIHEERE